MTYDETYHSEKKLFLVQTKDCVSYAQHGHT
jgi:hypothetical protein